MWKCIFDLETGKGVAFGREAQEGEFKVELPPSECGWFNSTPERYEYVNGIFSERSGWGQEQLAEKKSSAFKNKLSEIDSEVKSKASSPFTWNGNTWYPDVETIQGLYSVLPLLPEDYTEVWKTADLDQDGINNVYVTLDKAGVTSLALSLLTHKKSWWAAGEQKKLALKSLMADPATTLEDINAFSTSLD